MVNNKKNIPVNTSTGPHQIDNDIYNNLSEMWWNDSGFAGLLKHITNPWRVPYFQRMLIQHLENLSGKHLLDIGCGGGILAEELAAMGFSVTGIDPSDKSIVVAKKHAKKNNLHIDYRIGYGNRLPFENETFEVVACCDVLEHIHDWDAVIGEIARVLKHNGIFVFDTINRTTASKIFFIKMFQDWKFTRFLPPNLHVWNMFIKPEELKASLERHGLHYKDIKGTKPAVGFFQFLKLIRQYNTGKISSAELGKRLSAPEGSRIECTYMGYAIKP